MELEEVVSPSEDVVILGFVPDCAWAQTTEPDVLKVVLYV